MDVEVENGGWARCAVVPGWGAVKNVGKKGGEGEGIRKARVEDGYAGRALAGQRATRIKCFVWQVESVWDGIVYISGVGGRC